MSDFEDEGDAESVTTTKDLQAKLNGQQAKLTALTNQCAQLNDSLTVKERELKRKQQLIESKDKVIEKLQAGLRSHQPLVYLVWTHARMLAAYRLDASGKVVPPSSSDKMARVDALMASMRSKELEHHKAMESAVCSTDGRTGGRAGGRTDRRTHARTHARTYGRTHARTDARTDGRTHGRTDARTRARTQVDEERSEMKKFANEMHEKIKGLEVELDRARRIAQEKEAACEKACVWTCVWRCV